MLRIVTPDLLIGAVEELEVERIRGLGLDTLLLDVDGTLKRYGRNDVAPEVAAWIEATRGAGIGLCLVSNGLGRRIRGFAEQLRLPCVAKALKPLPFGLWAAVRKMGASPERTAIVGDQLFADVLGARLAGIKSILVRPIHPEEEPWFTQLKRPLERGLVRKISSDAAECAGGTNPYATGLAH